MPRRYDAPSAAKMLAKGSVRNFLRVKRAAQRVLPRPAGMVRLSQRGEPCR